MMDIPSKRSQVLSVVLECASVAIAAFPLLFIYIISGGDKWPNARGFFCDDQNLKHPVLIDKQTVPEKECFIYWAFLSIAIIGFMEIFHSIIYDKAITEAHKEKLLKVGRNSFIPKSKN